MSHLFHPKAPHRLIQRLTAFTLWLGLGFFVAYTVPLVPSPWEVLQSLGTLLAEPETYRVLFISWGRMLAGYLFASVLAVLLAELPPSFEPFIELPIRVLRAVPVAVLALILVFFLPAKSLSLWIPLGVVLPLTYTQAKAARSAVVPGTATYDLPRIYEVSRLRYFRFFYLPQRLPFWRTSMEQSFGLAVKSAIAGELLTLPAVSLGAALYDAKLYMQLDLLLAWTVLVLVFTALWERLLKLFLGYLATRLETGVSNVFTHDAAQLPRISNPLIKVNDLSFSYGPEKLFEALNLTFNSPHVYRLKAPTGQGKSTFLAVLTGLLPPQEGTVEYAPGLKLSMAFQDGRFLPNLSVLNQLRAISPYTKEGLLTILQACGLSSEDSFKSPAALSGGMQRQLGTARALAVPAHGVVLDESFAALDPQSKAVLATYLETELHDKLLIYVTHDDDPALFKDAQVVEL